MKEKCRSCCFCKSYGGGEGRGARLKNSWVTQNWEELHLTLQLFCPQLKARLPDQPAGTQYWKTFHRILFLFVSSNCSGHIKSHIEERKQKAENISLAARLHINPSKWSGSQGNFIKLQSTASQKPHSNLVILPCKSSKS